MRKLILTLAVFVGFGAAQVAIAQTADQNVTVIVKEITEMSSTLDDVTITIEAAEAGEDPDPVNESGGNMAIVSNTTDAKKVVAKLDGTYYDDEVTLAIRLNTRNNADITNSAADWTDLSTSDVDLFSGSQMKEDRIGIRYRASATYKADPNETGQTQVVTFTLTQQ
ncbi:MAG: hypothetical protein AAGI08_05805 [Bacteroidota bacterium]